MLKRTSEGNDRICGCKDRKTTLTSRLHLCISSKHRLLPILIFAYSLVSLTYSLPLCIPRSNRQFNRALLMNSPFTQDQLPSSPRKVLHLQKYARLPIWPLWNGVLLYLISKLPLVPPETVAALEASIGGRVCPNFFRQTDDALVTSPFIMLVHHTHTFSPFDPLRFIQKLFFPEGFPAHPHRGFCTITYCLHGGMIHRDSMGVRQSYGASRDHSTQLLVAGKGILHEEMWDIRQGGSKQELFQLWVNLPAKYKMIPPKIQLLSEREDSMPTVVEYAPQDKTITSSTLVIAGSFKDHHSTMTLYSELTILHVRLFRIPVQDESWKQVSTPSWTFHLPDHYSTAIIYVRSGSVDIAGTRIPPHHTAHLTSKGEALVVSLTNSTSHSWSFPPLSWNNATNQQQMGADFILLAGEPLNEPVVAQGSMVMNSYPEINRAYQDYQRGLFGLPWKETLSDADWQIHVKTYGIGSGNEI